MKALVGAFNHEKALVGALSMVVQLVVEPMDRFTALLRTVSGNGRFRFSPPVSSLNIGQRPGAGAAVWRQVR